MGVWSGVWCARIAKGTRGMVVDRCPRCAFTLTVPPATRESACGGKKRKPTAGLSTRHVKITSSGRFLCILYSSVTCGTSISRPRPGPCTGGPAGTIMLLMVLVERRLMGGGPAHPHPLDRHLTHSETHRCTRRRHGHVLLSRPRASRVPLPPSPAATCPRALQGGRS